MRTNYKLKKKNQYIFKTVHIFNLEIKSSINHLRTVLIWPDQLVWNYVIHHVHNSDHQRGSIGWSPSKWCSRYACIQGNHIQCAWRPHVIGITWLWKLLANHSRILCEAYEKEKSQDRTLPLCLRIWCRHRLIQLPFLATPRAITDDANLVCITVTIS